MTYTTTETTTFTLTHAKHIAAKVSTDLLRFTRYYKKPTVEQINRYEVELIAFLNAGYLDNVIYGYKRNGMWVEALRYHVIDGELVGDDDPGKIRPGTDVPGESFGSYLTHNLKWFSLTAQQRAAFEASLPFSRQHATEPSLESGAWSRDLNYSAGGRGLGRSIIVR